MVTKRIAIIPARGGSKRIPHKNIIDFCGKPMIAWTIQAAIQSGIFDRVLVSTDDQTVADTAIEWGAEAPFLREKFADDYSPVSIATADALKQAMSYWNEEYQSVTQLMANCPLRSENDIREAMIEFEKHKRRFQISCFKYGWMNPWWAVKLNSEQQPDRLFPEAATQRSQDLPELYCPTGAIWIAKTTDFLNTESFYGEDHSFSPLKWQSAVDIDDYDDLKFAETVYQSYQSHESE